jgi:hypothetical protein
VHTRKYQRREPIFRETGAPVEFGTVVSAAVTVSAQRHVRTLLSARDDDHTHRMDQTDAELTEYRKHVLLAEQKAQEDFDKT